jgi:hypothetical protein
MQHHRDRGGEQPNQPGLPSDQHRLRVERQHREYVTFKKPPLMIEKRWSEIPE